MTTRTKTLSILGTATDLPFLMRTGKVQQNAVDKGEGQWSIPNAGFTSQLKYRTTAGRFKGQLAGFTFNRMTTVDGYFNSAGARAVAQQPHITLIEVFNSEQGRNVIKNGIPNTTTSSWTAGANTTLSNQDADWGGGRRIQALRSSGSGTVSIKQTAAFESGLLYNLSFQAVAPNQSVIEVYAGTQYLRAHTQIGTAVTYFNGVAFVADADSDLIITCTGCSTTTSLSISLISATESQLVTKIAKEIWLCDEDAGVFHPDLDSLKESMLAAINAATTNCDYSLADGDLVCNTDGYTVFAMGPVPWVCGWGYIRGGLGPILKGGLGPIQWVASPGKLLPFSQPRANRSTPVSDPEYLYESVFGWIDFDRAAILALKNNNEDTPTQWAGVEAELRNASLIKNHSEHTYYWQCRLGDGMNYRTIYNATNSPRLRYITSSGSTLSVNDVIGLGPGVARVTAEGASSHAGIRYIKVASKKIREQDLDTADIVYMMPVALAWMTGWFDYYAENPDELPEGTTLTSIDPYPLVDASRSESDNPVKILKQLLGFPPTATNDAGIPPAYMCTTIADLFGYADNDRELIDWTTLRRLIDDTPQLEGVAYSMEVQQEADGSESATPKELNILQMLQGVCLTHGIRMIWKYSETQRSWILSFKRDTSDTLTQAINSGRLINDTNSVNAKPFEINGGNFRYCGVKAEYKRGISGKEQFNIKDPSGIVQHSIGGKILEVKDDLTVLPADNNAASEALIKHFGNLTRRLSMLSHKIKLDTALQMAAKMPVGDSVAIDLEYMRNPKSGRQNDGEQVGQVDGLTIDLGLRAKASAELMISKLALKGISPSLIVDTWEIKGYIVCTVSTAPSANLFADPAGGLTDAQTFFCYAYDDERGAYPRHTTCGEYSCYLVRLGVNSLYSSGANQNVFACKAASLDSGVLSLSSGDDLTNFPDESDGNKYLLCFARRDAADLQPCQHDYYGFLGDGDGLCHDSNGVAFTAITVGG